MKRVFSRGFSVVLSVVLLLDPSLAVSGQSSSTGVHPAVLQRYQSEALIFPLRHVFSSFSLKGRVQSIKFASLAIRLGTSDPDAFLAHLRVHIQQEEDRHATFAMQHGKVVTGPVYQEREVVDRDGERKIRLAGRVRAQFDNPWLELVFCVIGPLPYLAHGLALLALSLFAGKSLRIKAASYLYLGAQPGDWRRIFRTLYRTISGTWTSRIITAHSDAVMPYPPIHSLNTLVSPNDGQKLVRLYTLAKSMEGPNVAGVQAVLGNVNAARSPDGRPLGAQQLDVAKPSIYFHRLDKQMNPTLRAKAIELIKSGGYVKQFMWGGGEETLQERALIHTDLMGMSDVLAGVAPEALSPLQVRVVMGVREKILSDFEESGRLRDAHRLLKQRHIRRLPSMRVLQLLVYRYSLEQFAKQQGMDARETEELIKKTPIMIYASDQALEEIRLELLHVNFAGFSRTNFTILLDKSLPAHYFSVKNGKFTASAEDDNPAMAIRGWHGTSDEGLAFQNQTYRPHFYQFGEDGNIVEVKNNVTPEEYLKKRGIRILQKARVNDRATLDPTIALDVDAIAHYINQSETRGVIAGDELVENPQGRQGSFLFENRGEENGASKPFLVEPVASAGLQMRGISEKARQLNAPFGILRSFRTIGRLTQLFREHPLPRRIVYDPFTRKYGVRSYSGDIHLLPDVGSAYFQVPGRQAEEFKGPADMSALLGNIETLLADTQFVSFLLRHFPHLYGAENSDVWKLIGLGVISKPAHIAIIRKLFELNQGHLFERWSVKTILDDDRMRERMMVMLDELVTYDQREGLARYLQNAATLLADWRIEQNPFVGLIPLIPIKQSIRLDDLSIGSAQRRSFEDREKLGIQQAGRTVFALVAGGMGQRLGFNGLKVSIRPSSLGDEEYMRLFLEKIKELGVLSADGRKPVFFVMTSPDNHEQMIEKFESYGYQVADRKRDGELVLLRDSLGNEVTLGMQGFGPSHDVEGKLWADANRPYDLKKSPPGHGSVHEIIGRFGLIDQWETAGYENIVFFQDTNGNSFNAVPSLLGYMKQNPDTAMTYVTAPRTALSKTGSVATLVDDRAVALVMTALGVERREGEDLFQAVDRTIAERKEGKQAVGSVKIVMDSKGEKPKLSGVASLISVDEIKDYEGFFKACVAVANAKGWPVYTQNVEYNVINTLLKESVNGQGDIAAPGSSYTYFTLNLNLLGLTLAAEKEVVRNYRDLPNLPANPKFNNNKGQYDPQRVEKNMQEASIVLSKQGQRVDVVDFAPGELVFSTVKNDAGKAKESQDKNSLAEHPVTADAEQNLVWRRLLSANKVVVENVDGSVHVYRAPFRNEKTRQWEWFDIHAPVGSMISFDSRFAPALSVLWNKFKSGVISDRSALRIRGRDIQIKGKGLALDGALEIEVADGASLAINGLEVKNQVRYRYEPLTPEEVISPPDDVKGDDVMRGYRLVKPEGARIIRIEQPGEYKIGEDGKLMKKEGEAWIEVEDYVPSDVSPGLEAVYLRFLPASLIPFAGVFVEAARALGILYFFGNSWTSFVLAIVISALIHSFGVFVQSAKGWRVAHIGDIFAGRAAWSNYLSAVGIASTTVFGAFLPSYTNLDPASMLTMSIAFATFPHLFIVLRMLLKKIYREGNDPALSPLLHQVMTRSA